MKIKNLVNKTSSDPSFKAALCQCFGIALTGRVSSDNDMNLPQGGRYNQERYVDLSDAKMKKLVKMFLDRHGEWEMHFSANNEITSLEWPQKDGQYVKPSLGQTPKTKNKNFSRIDPKHPKENQLWSFPIKDRTKGDRMPPMNTAPWSGYFVAQPRWESLGYFLEKLNKLNLGLKGNEIVEVSMDSTVANNNVPSDFDEKQMESLIKDVILIKNTLHPSISTPMIQSMWSAKEKIKQEVQGSYFNK